MTTSAPAKSVAIAGATGLIGTALTGTLRGLGCTVIPISRRNVPDGIRWDPSRGHLDGARLEGVDAVVNLVGENLAGGRWTAERKQLLRDSRLLPTRLLAETIAGLSRPPAVLVSTSAVGIYGNRGDETLDESAAPGEDFLARLAREWESAAAPATEAGVRVAHTRFGVVLAAEGGVLERLLPPFRLGLGGPVGRGTQWLAWIALTDAVGVIMHLIENGRIAGAVNAVGPEQVTNAEFGATLGRVLHRPAIIPLPAFALKLAFGEMAEATILASQRVVPGVLQASGYRFTAPSLEAALRTAI